MSQSNNKPVALVLGAAVATGTLVAGSLFSMQAMANGYMQDAPKAEAKATEGKCGEATARRIASPTASTSTRFFSTTALGGSGSTA